MKKTFYIDTKKGSYRVTVTNGVTEPDSFSIHSPHTDNIYVATLKHARKWYGSVNKAIGHYIGFDMAM